MGKAEDNAVEYVRERIAAERDYAFFVFRVIWSRQKPIEKQTGQYAGSDNRGFQEESTPFYNGLYARIGAQKRPTDSQYQLLQERMPIHARQYVRDCLERGIDVYSRGPKVPGTDTSPKRASARTAKVNRHPVIRKGDLSEERREQMWRNIQAMADAAGV